jgi:hypothetical protein
MFTAQTKLPPSVLNARYEGTWAADIDADGDLDIVCEQRKINLQRCCATTATERLLKSIRSPE